MQKKRSKKISNTFILKEHSCSLMQLKPLLPWGHGWPWGKNMHKLPPKVTKCPLGKKGPKLPWGANMFLGEQMCVKLYIIITFAYEF
jgi:hypothetical protein